MTREDLLLDQISQLHAYLIGALALLVLLAVLASRSWVPRPGCCERCAKPTQPGETLCEWCRWRDEVIDSWSDDRSEP